MDSIASARNNLLDATISEFENAGLVGGAKRHSRKRRSHKGSARRRSTHRRRSHKATGRRRSSKKHRASKRRSSKSRRSSKHMARGFGYPLGGMKHRMMVGGDRLMYALSPAAGKRHTRRSRHSRKY